MKSHRSYTPWLMLLPALIWLAVFSLWPSLNTVALSFTNVHLITGGHFVGLHNYDLLLHDEHLWDAVFNSLFFVVFCVPLLTFLPLLLAMLVQRELPFIGFFRTAYYFPVIASAVSVALIWGWMLDERGLINGLAQQMGLVHRYIPFLIDR
jgi:ABC-type sugar transport system permease subunit